MATELGKAYVQIIPSARGISGALASELGGAGTEAGQTAGLNIASAIKGVIAAAGIGEAFKSVVDAGMTFDSSMSQVAATMGTTVDQIQELRDFAQEMGATTAFSASEAADALNYMALAGYDAETSMEMLPTVLNLAAAGSIDLAYASDMVTDTQTALGLSVERTSQLVDEMAKTASTTNTSVEQLGEAMLTIGGTAKNLNGGFVELEDGTRRYYDSTQELSMMLGILADNGIKGSEAGTHMRNVIMSLTSPTDKAATQLELMGVSVYDAGGNMRSMTDIIGDLNGSLDTMTAEERQQAISTIFNKTDIAAVNALLDTSADRWTEVALAITEAWMSGGDLNEKLQGIGLSLDGLATNFEALGVDASTFNTILAESGGDAQAFADALWEASDQGVTYDDVVNALGGDLGALQTAFNETTGAAQAMADTQLDNLAGDITLFESALEGAKIALSDQLTPALRGFVQEGGELLSNFTQTLNSEGLTAAIVGLVTDLVSTGVQSVLTGIQQVTANVPELVDSGVQIVSQLIVGLVSAIPDILAAALQLIAALGESLLTYDWSGTASSMVSQIQTNLDTFAASVLGVDTGIVDGIIQGITVGLPMLMQQAVDLLTQFLGNITSSLPSVITEGTQIVTSIISGITQTLPSLITTAGQITTTMLDTWLENLPQILQAGVDLLLELIKGIINSLPDVVLAIAEVIATIIATVVEHLPEILQTGVDLLLELLAGILNTIPDMVAALPQVIDGIKGVFDDFDWLSIGKNLMEGIKNGILGAIDGVVNAAKNAAESVWDSITGFFGIESPAKKGIYAGEMIGAGMEIGLERSFGGVETAADVLAARTMGSLRAGLSADLRYVPSGADTTSRLDAVVGLLERYLPECAEKQPLDGRSLVQSINRELGLAAI